MNAPFVRCAYDDGIVCNVDGVLTCDQCKQRYHLVPEYLEMSKVVELPEDAFSLLLTGYWRACGNDFSSVSGLAEVHVIKIGSTLYQRKGVKR